MTPTFLRFSTFLVLAATPLFAQGTGSYFNVESPQRKPITVVRIASHDYLVACNTPDNCIEIYDTHNNSFLVRVQTGAEPISVVYNAPLKKLYTCNFLGDSVSVITLRSTGPASSLTATLERTTYVGDEPNHLAFAPDNLSLYVTLGSQSAVSQRSTADLSLVAAPQLDLLDHRNPFIATRALKDPCTAIVRQNKLFVLGNRGGKALPPLTPPLPNFDFDLWTYDLVTLDFIPLGSLGTTNFNMAFSQTGDLWVVGSDAQFDVRGEANVKAQTTGFVQSKIFKVTGAGTAVPAPTIAFRDLNKNPAGLPVTKARGLSQPTDLALYEPAGTLQKVYVAAFDSDLVGMLPAVGGAMNGSITVITIPLVSGSTNARSGPRGLAVKYANVGVAGDPGDRVYVMDRLDNAVCVLNPATDAVVQTFALQRDPTPAYVRTGRKFLYSAKLSGNGFDSCASCHVDGRSDWINWDLSDNSYQPFPTNSAGFNSLNDGVAAFPANPPSAATDWPPNKSFLITQSLQGMVNYETLPEVQGYFSNEPLHWRADRANFQAFKGAFTNLMGLSVGDPLQPTDPDMDAFAKFAFSIAYPPNPEEPEDRVHSGTLGTATSRDDGTGAQRGLKLFHILAVTSANCSGRSCVQCHWLPEGSNNKIGLFVEDAFNAPYIGGVGSGVNRQPMETPAIRMLREKEAEIIRVIGGSTLSFQTAMFGLLSQGSVASINDFVSGAFPGSVIDSDATHPPIAAESPDLIQFIRELDPGVGPLVGQSVSIDLLAPTSSRIALFEAQADLANCGVAVQGVLAGVKKGYWYDPTITSAPSYHEEPGGAILTSAALLALVTQSTDLLVYHATALGSERRIAWPTTGSPAPLAGSAPANITLEPMKPNTAFAPVPGITRNWSPGTGTNDFNWNNPTEPTPAFLKLVRIFQIALINKAPAAWGVTSPRHEAPRRFRVAMDNGRHGARLILKMGTDSANQPPNSTTFKTFELPLHPTKQVNASGKAIWETAVEADPMTIFTLMLGGPAAPDVATSLENPFPMSEAPVNPALFDPSGWNSFLVDVKNEDSTTGSGGWQPIRIQ